MREEDKQLFPLTTIGAVTQLFCQHLTGDHEPDLVLLSVVSGYIESSMTTCRSSASIDTTLKISEEKLEEDPEVADVENLKIDQVDLHTVEALCSKFESIIKGYCDLSSFGDEKYATRNIIKLVSDIVWNTLTKAQYKDRAHLQSIYSYLTGSKLDCFGVAFAVVAGCQLLGFSDVHLALSEDHAWVTFGENFDQTAEVTWHGKGNEDKRGQSVEIEKATSSWKYVGGQPVVCNRYMEVSALVSSINPAITAVRDSLEVGVLQQELLWLLYDLGHLEKYPLALGNLGDLEELSATPGRPPSIDLFNEAIFVNRTVYKDFHVYPYTYRAGAYYRQKEYKSALKAWAEAAGVIKRYKYSKDDEEIYKEFMEINNELIPHILKSEATNESPKESVLHDSSCFGSLLQFFDGLCCWEEDSSTPVLHIGWVKPMVKNFTAFDYSVRQRLDIECIGEAKSNIRSEGNTYITSNDGYLTEEGLFPENLDQSFYEEGKHEGHYIVDNEIHENEEDDSSIQPVNNNYEMISFNYDILSNSSQKNCDNIGVSQFSVGHSYSLVQSTNSFKHYSIYQKKKYNFDEELYMIDFDRIGVVPLMRHAQQAFNEKDLSTKGTDVQKILQLLSMHTADRLLNIDFFMGKHNADPFLDFKNQLKLCQKINQNVSHSRNKNYHLPEKKIEADELASKKMKKGERNKQKKVKLFSSKMKGLKDLIQAEKLNSSALHLHLTAQSQTEVKRNKIIGDDFAGSRVKRSRRE